MQSDYGSIQEGVRLAGTAGDFLTTLTLRHLSTPLPLYP